MLNRRFWNILVLAREFREIASAVNYATAHGCSSWQIAQGIRTLPKQQSGVQAAYAAQTPPPGIATLQAPIAAPAGLQPPPSPVPPATYGALIVTTLLLKEKLASAKDTIRIALQHSTDPQIRRILAEELDKLRNG